MKTIGIKLADGSFYPVLEEFSNSEKELDLTTAHNNQTKVTVDLYRSKNCTMDDAEYVDSLQIENLVARPNGEPDISFSVSIDENNKLSAKIKDAETGNQSKTTITLVSRTLEERLNTDDYKIADSAKKSEQKTSNHGFFAMASKIRKSNDENENSDEPSEANSTIIGFTPAADDEILKQNKNQPEEELISDDETNEDFIIEDNVIENDAVAEINETSVPEPLPDNDDDLTLSEEDFTQNIENFDAKDDFTLNELNEENFDEKGDFSQNVETPNEKDDFSQTDESFDTGDDVFAQENNPFAEDETLADSENDDFTLNELNEENFDEKEDFSQNIEISDEKDDFSQNVETPDTGDDIFANLDLPGNDFSADEENANILDEEILSDDANSGEENVFADNDDVFAQENNPFAEEETLADSENDDFTLNELNEENFDEKDDFSQNIEISDEKDDFSQNVETPDAQDDFSQTAETSGAQDDLSQTDEFFDTGDDIFANLDLPDNDFSADSEADPFALDEDIFSTENDSSENLDETIFGDEISDDFSLPNVDEDENFQNQLSESKTEDFFNSNDSNDDFEGDSQSANVDNKGGGALSFTGLYDRETELGESAEDENIKRKTKIPVIICIICAIICIIATLLILFIVPSKYNLLNKSIEKIETEIMQEKLPQESQTITEPEPAPKSEPEPEIIPPAKEEEIVVIEKAEIIVPEQPPVAQEKPKNTSYKIKWGDTLWDIADTYYKDPWRYKYIANFNQIKDPDFIISGTYIIIPAE